MNVGGGSTVAIACVEGVESALFEGLKMSGGHWPSGLPELGWGSVFDIRQPLRKQGGRESGDRAVEGLVPIDAGKDDGMARGCDYGCEEAIHAAKTMLEVYFFGVRDAARAMNNGGRSCRVHLAGSTTPIGGGGMEGLVQT